MEQKIFDIGGLRVGGQPGELPTVLIGSIFHVGHRIVSDHTNGVFDVRKAESLIKVQEEMSEKTGNPHMVDIVGETPEALKRYIGFISEITEAPFLINGLNATVRLEGAKYAREIGLIDRAVYTSINYTVDESEVRGIRDSGMKAGIVQAFNPREASPKGMRSILEGAGVKEGLLKVASEAGLEKILVLAPVLDIPSIAMASEGIRMLKGIFGLPTGAAPLGVVGMWRRAGDFGLDAKKTCRGAVAAMVQTAGADFIIYGSIEKAKSIFPACAMIDAIIAYGARRSGVKPLTRDHPLYRIF
ncbi:tetrahydromethanopterin S-methyltransferase subunit H [Candidatus Bathyarchaeota archaeon]|nr:tetrahydromethanopterin S-methyltransferase subunit H [Candidatus Bathyarchaeota archaeon]